jgi:CheY-like chemotaxis protein
MIAGRRQRPPLEAIDDQTKAPPTASSPLTPIGQLESSISTAASPQLEGPDRVPRSRVLLADDNRDLQLIFASQLVLLGLEVVGVSNGRDAVDLALSALRAGNPFDLILLDLEMPVLDGYQAATQLRDGGYSGPILALTAHSGDESRLDCLKLGCDDCLCKPFDSSQLRELIRKFLPGVSLLGSDRTLEC